LFLFRFLDFNTNYDPQAKIWPCERHKVTNRNSYLNTICIKLVTQVKKKLKFGLLT